MLNFVLSVMLSTALAAAPTAQIEATETGILVTYQDGTGYYIGE